MTVCLGKQGYMIKYICMNLLVHFRFEGKNCEININECQIEPCKNGATCLDKYELTLYVCYFLIFVFEVSKLHL